MGKAAGPDLKEYRAKRRFDETREPHGGAGIKDGALFVVQKHAARRLHYDFRLELNGVLLSWAVTRGPSYNTKDRRLAVRTEDHPLEYGQFEGTIPKGNYGAGTVMLWDSGNWSPVGDAKKGLRNGKLVFNLAGERLRGRWALVRMRPNEKDKKAKRENWLLIKELDDYANTRGDLLEAETASVASGREMERIADAGASWQSGGARAALPAYQEPMLARLVDEPPQGGDWIFEIKYDGYRAMIAADRDQVKIFTRSGLDWTAKFPQVAKAVAALKLDHVLLDGEIVVVDKAGVTDFAALVAALESGKGALSYFAFDLLARGDQDLSGAPLMARKEALQNLLGNLGKNSIVQLSEVFSGGEDAGANLYKTACAHGLEGIIAKRADAPYRSGRHEDWLKIKCGADQEFVIIGFAPSERSRPFASLLLAVNEGGALRYAGRVGTGFSDRELERLASLRDKYNIKRPLCEVPPALARDVIWVKPVMIAQIEFAGWTGDDMIRHGRYKGLREDKPPREIVKETPKIAAVTITHGERLIYPEQDISKADVAAYVELAAPLMMPYVQDRLVSFLRCPEGAAGKCFFQRHPLAGLGKDWRELKVGKSRGRNADYVYCNQPEALVKAVQMGVLEFHIWGSKIQAVEKPDRIVFDLDPDEGLEFAEVRKAAFRLRDVLAALDLQSLPMLSGGKGVHIVVPVKPLQDWEVVKEFAGDMAKRVAADAPEKFVATMTKAKRHGKIFIDYFRNDRSATAIAPYSPRARAAGAVAWPLTWPTLESAKAADMMTIQKARVALQAGENGWAAYGQIKQKLSSAALRAVRSR